MKRLSILFLFIGIVLVSFAQNTGSVSIHATVVDDAIPAEAAKNLLTKMQRMLTSCNIIDNGADRFVLTLINNRVMDEKDFIRQESGAVLLNDDGRRKFFKYWQDKKREGLTHPYLGEKLQWGMVPYIQAQLLARYLRGDLDDYPPFLWK